ncbi:FxSxx-COOH system tetratricopeptide repeat protein [Streptomyces sp. NPDC056785]|uniref:FxSxx-COOH system tetratricopeptide repeat protein n=1 Tax=Streptomyces sp. NPDC056785 TaxID=3345944 RepID=UPI003690D494
MSRAAESVFVSYAGADRAWAEWVAWHLREAGHRVELDVWDWRTGDNFVERMEQALRRATAVVALFSNTYFDPARWTHEEWTSVVAGRRRLVPLTITPLSGIDIPDILAAAIRKDLHGLDEQAAITALRDAVDGPTGPLTPPQFPGSTPVSAPREDASGGRPRLPSSAGMPGVWNVPSRNPRFTGREASMTRVREGLLDGGQAVVQAVHGLGGIGKTQLALEYAHRFASQYDVVWWIDAEQADQIPVHYTELATRLGIATAEAGTGHSTQSLLAHLRTLDRWLIVLDNAEDPGVFKSVLPPAGPGHVLITSRNPGWKDTVPSHGLDVFARGDSVAYLTTSIPRIAAEQADALADDLGDLPLALAQAAGIITTGMTPDRYRHLLTSKTTALMGNGGPPNYPASLAATVDIATARLADEHPQAADLLRLAAFLGPDPIPTAWLETSRDQMATLTVDPDDFMWPQTALQPLARFGLANVDHETFQIHRLIQAIVRDHSGEADTTAAEDDVSALLTAIAPTDTDDPATWSTWASLTSHLTARLHAIAQHPPLHQTLINTVDYLCVSGQARAGRYLATTLRPAWIATLGDDHPDTLSITYGLATSLAHLGEYEQARRMHADSLERRRRALGDNHPDTLQSANNLASTLAHLGEYEQARRMDEGTLQRRRRALGDDHPDTLQSAHNLATALARLGEYEQARRLHADTLERHRRTLGDDHPVTLHSANNLSGTLARLGEYKQARRLYEDTLERRRRALGDDHPDTLSSANNLATTLSGLGEYEQGRRMHEDTLERRRRALGDDHPDTLQSANNLASTLARVGEYEPARRMHEDTLEHRRRALGDDHPDTLQSANNLATTLSSLGEYEQGRRMHEDTLERRQRTLGNDHPDTLQSAHNLSGTLDRLGEYEQGRRMDEDTLERRRRTLGDNHPDTLQTANNLATALSRLGDYEQGRRMHEDTLERRRRTLGDNHPDTLQSANNLASVLAGLRQFTEAEQLLRDTRARSRRVVGDDHPDTQKVTENLARVLTALGRPFEAQKLRASGSKGGKRRARRKHR